MRRRVPRGELFAPTAHKFQRFAGHQPVGVDLGDFVQQRVIGQVEHGEHERSVAPRDRGAGRQSLIFCNPKRGIWEVKCLLGSFSLLQSARNSKFLLSNTFRSGRLMNRLTLVIWCFSAMTLVRPTQATVVVSNLGNTPAPSNFTYWPVGTGSISALGGSHVYHNVAVPFTTDNQSYLLDNIQLNLETTTAGALTVGLYSDNNSGGGSVPGTLLASLTGTTSPLGVTTYLPSIVVYLSASTKYHVVVDADAASTYKWVAQGFPLNPSGPGTMFNSLTYFEDNVLTVSGTYIPMFAVNGTSAVPEAPASLMALVAGIASAIVFRQRKRATTN